MSCARATDACVLASNNASPAQRGPRRDAQSLHATPLAAVLFPASAGRAPHGENGRPKVWDAVQGCWLEQAGGAAAESGSAAGAAASGGGAAEVQVREYKCGTCGFLPKKKQHDCAAVLAEKSAGEASRGSGETTERLPKLSGGGCSPAAGRPAMPARVDVEQPPDWLAAGAEVEVEMGEEGLRGSLYGGKVLQLRKGKALVQYAAFCVEAEEEGGGDGEAPLLTDRPAEASFLVSSELYKRQRWARIVLRACSDMAKFGGPGTLKQPCARRVCEHLRAGKPAEGGGKRDGGGFALCALPAGLKATLPAHDVARLGRALLASVSARPEGRVLEAASSPPEGEASRGGASLGEIRARLDGGGYGEDVSAFAADVRALYVRLHSTEEELENLRSFLVECGGEGDSVLAGWSVKLCVAGDYFLYYSATGRVFRSRAEAAQQ
ncbi:hypothetical protein EMIHUDRAFT_213552 [Emiliania huxleyi CCMP1516]|uniref:Uncharacterized protein n=2 Tax=Emiliania huxleyi TaxID=2903 RepID=A0A0D3IM61_EMIH1|nr:hypothetical protein EMIHUDRAFT_213552 [Emiliania huxleyi CCMP1516]EOD12346.1 hypothetical protein EMIHUDRAFT_213552 [Emiliania huxleyi CCMP1516]|eukprot:XP_005764775.1 hypothetical protein EMIHUDRAFT_213552 [Emiliania huxleyi CCMP1516]